MTKVERAEAKDRSDIQRIRRRKKVFRVSRGEKDVVSFVQWKQLCFKKCQESTKKREQGHKEEV